MPTINKKYIWLGFIGVSLVSVVYLSLNLRTQNETPKTIVPVITVTPPLIQPPKEVKVNIIEIDPSLNWPETKDLASYQASISSVDLVATAQKMADSLNISKKSNTPPVWSDSEYTRYINIDNENGVIKYQIDGYAKPDLYTGKNPTTLPQAVLAAQTFVKGFPIWKDFKLDESSLHYTAGETTLASVSFYPTFNGFLLSYDNQIQAPLTIEVGQKNTVVVVTYIPKNLNVSSSPTEAELVTKEEALQKITSGQILPMNLRDYKLTTENSKQINRIVVDKVVLEYRVISSQGKAYPFYRIMGQGVFYLVPAIKL